MFRKTEKKIKAVFKLQFQATQVPQLKAKNLMISLVPVDVGKATVKLPKASIVEGICTWEKPVLETVKLTKEIKTGIIREKFYYVVVSTGSNKSGFLGEVSIDFADLAEANKPVKLTLPLQTSKSGAILHVIVQKMQAESNSRHEEDNEASIGESIDSEDLSELASSHNGQNGTLEDAESDSNGTDSSLSVRVTNQMKMLERKVELSELEAETVRKQLVKDTKRRQQLMDQIASLVEERDSLKLECEDLKMSGTGKNDDNPVQEIEQKLQFEKQLNKKLKLQVQKAEDSNSEYVLKVRDLNKKLEQKNERILALSSKVKELYSGGKTTDQDSDEEEKLKQKIEELYAEIEVHNKEKADLKMELEKLNLDYASLEEEYKEIYSKLEQSENVKMEIQQNYTESLAELRQFKIKVARLEADNKRQAVEYSHCLDVIDGLEAQVESLQKEHENQAQVFEEDLDMVSEAKDEMERRAIRAEEALRVMKRSNTSEAEKVKEEMVRKNDTLEKLSIEMSLKIDENEKIALKNETLEELIKKTNDELRITREKFENLYEEQQSKGTSEGNECIRKEKEDLERELALVKEKLEKLMQENVLIKSQMNQKKTKEDNLNLEVKKLRLKNNEVRNQLQEMELEKGNLKKEITKLQGDLRKKKQGSERSAAQNNTIAEQKNGNADNSRDVSSLSSEIASLQERNKRMESELKEMHEKYSEVSLRFAEVEGERQQLALAVRNLKIAKKS